MTLNYNARGDGRKELVSAIEEILGIRSAYLGMPTAGYQIGEYMVTRFGTLGWDEDTDPQELVRGLIEKGFRAEGDEEVAYPAGKSGEHAADVQAEDSQSNDQPQLTEREEVSESTDDAETSDTASLSITLPDDLTDLQFEHLRLLVEGKTTLLRHAFLTENLNIERSGGKLTFPWFTASDGDHTHAYAAFLTHLIRMAKDAKRVTTQDRAVENEKYSFRVFLIRLGMNGEEFKTDRKILLENLRGNSAWKNGHNGLCGTWKRDVALSRDDH